MSTSTVLRVLNDSTSVSEEKRLRVTEAVSALGYTPNPAAVHLLRRATHTAGAVLPYISGEFFAELLRGLDDTVQRHGFLLVVSAWQRNALEFRAALRSMYRRVDGLVIMEPGFATDAASNLVEDGLPVAFINTPATGGAQRAQFRQLRQHVRAVAPPPAQRPPAHGLHPNTEHDAQDRPRAWRDAIRQFGGDAAPDLELDGDFSVECGYRGARDVLAMHRRPTAIVGANDQGALGALRHLLRAGLRVPEDMSVAGFDGIPSTRYSTPTLTTVRVPIREIAVRAIRHVLQAFSGDGATANHVRVLPAELVVRESTRPHVTHVP